MTKEKTQVKIKRSFQIKFKAEAHFTQQTNNYAR